MNTVESDSGRPLLMIDDDRKLCGLIRDYLLPLGWRVEVRHTGPEGVVAMLVAILTFVFLFAALTSLRGPLSNPGHVVSRSLKLGTKIRSWISGISLLMLPLGPAMLFMPDFWCGFLSVSILNQASRILGLEIQLLSGNPSNGSVGFLTVYTTTMLEGFILSFLLLMISFFALFFLHRKAQRRTALGYPAFED